MKRAPASPARRPTMADVAKQAQVSPTTVSFVLNNVTTANISEQTRQRVLDTIKDLGYRPNAAARNVRTSRTDLIGFIAEEIATSPFSGTIVKGAQDRAWAQNKILLIVDTFGHPDMQQAAIEMMLDRQVEGIIFAKVSHRQVETPDNFFQVPTVLVNCFDRARALPSVVPDEVRGGYTATEALLRQGHRRIGVVMGHHKWIGASLRMKGYRQALAQHGIRYDPRIVRHCDWWQECGYENVMNLMQVPSPPTAIFCGNDRIALGAYDALKEMGLQIPRDISVIGFDNQEIIAAHARPRLTTVELPHYQMGQWAVNYLLENGADTREPIQAMLECPLIERDSIGQLTTSSSS